MSLNFFIDVVFSSSIHFNTFCLWTQDSFQILLTAVKGAVCCSWRGCFGRTGLSSRFLFFSGIQTRFCKQCPLMYWYLLEPLVCSFVLSFLISFSINVFPRSLQFLSCDASGTTRRALAEKGFWCPLCNVPPNFNF